VWTPEPGHVIRYAYLWREQAEAGQEEGVKDRPCAVLLSVADDTRNVVTVLPITHTPPRNEDDAVEIPAATKRRLGLDDDRSWIVTREANRFTWPGPDVRPRPGGGLESAWMGTLPAGLFRKVRDQFIAHWRARSAGVVTRTI